ncbi:hypothetical protein [Nocardioides mangrovi]|uniref:Lipoprotein n=1 Tax=Nocardioides mangrovi TaxID=2874580 RepID=A0ABS7U9G2_9ACTN|nr:hypothetical protein [Nocardioides mangrovi]MBZ5737620.1 hypothetical protein [Nocardioides mangrovi]
MRLLGPFLVAAALVLGGCGSDQSGGSAPVGSGTVADALYHQVAMITVTEGGGQVTDQITWVDSERSLRRYVFGFPSEQLQREVLAAAEHADLDDGQRLGAAVVDLGCSPPNEVSVTGSGADLSISASGKPSAEIQCLAPITTVALVAVDDSLSAS